MNQEAFPHGRCASRAASPHDARSRLLARSDAQDAPSAAMSCEEAIEALIRLAQATLAEPEGSVVSERGLSERGLSEQQCFLEQRFSERRAPKRSGVSSNAADKDTAKPATTAQQQLTHALRNLEPELALKVRTLMVAGRDAQSIHTVRIHMTLADSASRFHAAANDTSENGPLLAEYLRRGQALAHASGLDLERPIAGWAKVDASQEERAWQRFGRQLAQSHPDDWHCLLVAAESAERGRESAEHGSQLYLQHAEHGSWSFHAQLDRAAPVALDTSGPGLRRTGAASISTRSLGALVPRLRKAQGLALRRAARAICARVGTPEQL